MNESRLLLLLKMESVFTIWRPPCSLSAPAAPSYRLPTPPPPLHFYTEIPPLVAGWMHLISAAGLRGVPAAGCVMGTLIG